MGGLSQLARALRSGPSAPAAPPPTGLSSLAARLRTGVVPAANEGPNGKAVALRSSAGAEEYASNDREATKKTALAERALAAATAEPTEARIHAAHAALDEASAWHQRAAWAGERIGKDVTRHWELSQRLVAQREEIARVRPLEYREAPSGNRGGATPREPKPKEPSGDRDAEFAAAVDRAARTSRTGQFGNNQIFVSHVYRQAKRDGSVRGTLEAFKERLVQVWRKGSLVPYGISLSRADLVEAMDPADVRDSQIKYLNAELHFVTFENVGHKGSAFVYPQVRKEPQSPPEVQDRLRLLHEKMVELGGEHGPVRLRDLRGVTGLIRVDEDEALGEAEYLRQIALVDKIPSDVGPEDERAAIWRGGRPHYFVRRVKARKARASAQTAHRERELGGDELAAQMQSAFDELDVKSGHHNQVRLYDLRKALKGVSREAFDAALEPLRRHVFTLSAEEGRFGRLPPEVVEAGIPGPSGRLVYVARRLSYAEEPRAEAARPGRAPLTHLAARLAAHAPEPPSPRLSNLAARLTSTPRVEVVRRPAPNREVPAPVQADKAPSRRAPTPSARPGTPVESAPVERDAGRQGRATPARAGSIVRYVGSGHPHLAGLEGRVLDTTNDAVTVYWRHRGGSPRPADPRDPRSYRDSDLRVLRDYTAAFRPAGETSGTLAPSLSPPPAPLPTPAPSPTPASQRAFDLVAAREFRRPGEPAAAPTTTPKLLTTGTVAPSPPAPASTPPGPLPPEPAPLTSVSALRPTAQADAAGAEGPSAPPSASPARPQPHAEPPPSRSQEPRVIHLRVGDDVPFAEARAATDGATTTEDEDEETPNPEPVPSLVERIAPVEHRTVATRRDANIKAMELAADLVAHPRPLTEDDRRTLLEYSDWGGVLLQKWADRFPPGFPVPEKRQLIHAYFTPPAVCAEIARIVKPRLPELMSVDGKVHALEPSAGIGRFPLALSGPGFEALVWHCVEYSTVSSTMLHLLRPDIDLFQGPFERWIAERADAFAGRLKLIISNPPYGKRNMALTEDPDRSYRYDRADAYFLRRGLDLLGAGGLGIYIIPSGFLTGATEDAKKFRAEVLRRHHLAAAFRLPNEVFSLANVVTDLLLFRARGAILPEVDEADRFVLEGRYYEEFPTHILGMLVPNVSGKRGWHTTAEGYTVVGAFTAIPPFEERPICARCQHLPAPGPIEPPSTPDAAPASKAEPILEGEKHHAAAGLGRRVQAFLASVANPDHEPIGWDELHHDLSEWAETHGAPGKDQEVLVLAQAERGPRGHGEPGGAGWLLKAFLGASSTLIPPLAERPRWAPRFLGDANDPLQMGDYLYRTHKTLRIDELPGKDPSALFAAGWCEDSLSPAWTERLDVRGELFPPDEYLFGELWPKFDRADARGRLGDVQAAAQARRLLELIQPATFDEIEISPQDGFVPLDLLATWLATLNHGEAVHLVRDKGLVHLSEVAYEDHGRGLLDLSQEALLCLGWINHDYVVFQPHAGKDENIDEIRLAYAKDWTERFRAFCEADSERQRVIERSYQRARQGYRAHAYGSEPLKLLRWNPAIVLNPHQIAGARRLDANHGGGLAFDVGVGKTFTVLAALALARQQGRARRPVIVVPQPIALQWVDNFAKALPDYRVVVIGLNKKTLSRGLRKGLETSETDTPEERSRKWARFQGGEFDVAIVTYESLPRSKMDQASMLRFIEGVTAIEREVEIKRRNAKLHQRQSDKSYLEKKDALEARLAKAKHEVEFRFGLRKQKAEDQQRQLEKRLQELEDQHQRRRLTERQEAIVEEGVGAWLAETLELPEGWKHDPDIVWQQLGITWIAFDEAHNGKNLHMPSSREGGSVPKFMGNEGEGSHRAWHWYFRCCDVQSRGGEVVLATATPASNSPLEFYNLVKLIDDKAWTRIGIHDPEAFIDRFCLLEPEEVVTVDLQTSTRMACVGFKNLDELRSVLMKAWEFKTAKQARLKLPTPTIDRVFVDMDVAQEKKYQQYVEEIENALAHPGEGSNKILGLLQRMASVAQHAQLDEKFDWNSAHLVTSPHSPKYDALAKRVLARTGCGHIVFSDYVPAHAWIRDVLIEAGVPRERIGILNAVVAPSAADRQRTAREFNGSESVAPKYDVLIANMIGEEGVDLQRRACAIHHMDIGWTPKKFDQRNGRGYRQGNTLSNIEILYYIANRSQDGSRLDMVRGKQNWISSLLESEGKEVNNPAAQSTLTRKELLVLISRDPEKTRARLEAAEAEREEERKKKVAAAASGTLRAVANRFDRARTEPNPTVAAENLSVARQKLAGLAKVDPAIWPWMAWAEEAERHPMRVPKEGGPVYEGLRVAMPRLLDRSRIDYAEFGRIEGNTIATRVAGTANWAETSLDEVVQLRLTPEMRLTESSAATWPADDQAGVDQVMTETWLPRLRSGAGTSAAWTELGWNRAPDAFVERQCAKWGPEIVRAMGSTGGWAANLRVPVITNGRLVVGLRPPHGEVLPPTVAGWRRFLELGPASGETFSVLEEVGRWWFGRSVPRNLLSAAREETPASSAPRSKANATASPDFEQRFEQAFSELEMGTNYVTLFDLRRALSDVPREAFDAGVKSLRHASRFSLDSADGRHVQLPQAVLDAGLREGQSLLVYAARR